MNRREALQAGLGVLTAVKVDGEVATLSPRNPQAFVLTPKVKLSDDDIARMRRQWESAFSGTSWKNVPVIVMKNGMELSVVDKVEG